MRLTTLLVTLAACGDKPCKDPDGNELPVCLYEAEGEAGSVNIEYCPGDHWAAADGCNSCGCDDEGNVQCTSAVCDGAPPAE
jgi:hypothetical protein